MLATRIPFAAVGGVSCSLALFFGLWHLVGEQLTVVAKTSGPVFNYTRPRIASTPASWSSESDSRR